MYSEYVEALRPRRVLKPEDGFRIEQVWFPVTSPLVLPTVGQDSMSGDSRRRIRRRVPAGDLLCDDVEADSTELGHRSGEVTVDEFLGEADGFEDLRPAVGRDRGDAHLGHHLQQALAHGLDVVADRLLHANALEHVPVDEVFGDGLKANMGHAAAPQPALEKPHRWTSRTSPASTSRLIWLRVLVRTR